MPWKIVKENWRSVRSLSRSDEIVLIRSRAFYDDEYWCMMITDKWTRDKATKQQFPMGAFQLEMLSILHSKRNAVIIVPRNHSKTSTVSKAGSTKRLCYQLEKEILLVSSEGLGEDIIGDIREQFETNYLLTEMFGDLIPGGSGMGEAGKHWRQKSLQLTNGCSIKTLTKDQPIRGLRPTLIIVDDPQEKKDVKNPRIAEEYLEWFNTTLLGTLNPLRSSVIVLGTIISDNCLVNVLRNSASAINFEKVEYVAIKDFETLGFDGELLWPGRWTKEMLIQKDITMHRPNFLQEFQNIALPFTGRMALENLEMPKVISPIGHFGIFDVYKDITDERYTYKQLHFGFDFSDGKPGNDYHWIDVRNEAGQLVFQVQILCTQQELVKQVDELIEWLLSIKNESGKQKFRIALNPEVNYGKVFMDRARDKHWFRLMRTREKFDSFTKKLTKEPGWLTSGTTKPLLVACVQDYIDHGLEVSKVQLEEMKHYVVDEHGGTNAMAGWHDDSVIGAGTSLLSVKRGSPADLTKFWG